MEKKTTAKGLFFLIVAAVVWGFAFVAQSVGSAYVNTLVYNGIRFTIGGLSLIPVIWVFEKGATDKKMMRTTLLAGLVGGVVLFTASTLQQYGIELYNKAGFPDSSGRAGFLTALYMVIVPLIGLFLKKRPSAETWFGIALAVAGLFLISFTNGFSVSFEDLVVIGCAFLFAIHIIVIDRFGDEMYSLRFAMTQFLVCAALSGLFALIGTASGMMEANTMADIKAALPSILYGGFMSVGIAYTFQILGQKNAEPAFASIILSTESMFSVIGGALILGETMTVRGYVGCALIFAGVILTQVKIFRRKKV